jgi:hypothetical protein
MPSYDSAWKELIDRFLELVLALLFPDVWAEIDWAQGYEALDPALRKIVPEGETGDRLADKLLLARAKGSGDPRLLHFEAQGKKQHEFERRVYGYNYRAFDSLALPPEALVVLADDDPDWRPTRYEVVLTRTTLTFTFRPVKLISDWLPRLEELRKHENPVGLFLVAHLEAQRTAKDVGRRSEVKLGLLLELASRKLDEEDTRIWYRLLDWLLELPEEVDAAIYTQARTKLREGAMPYVSFADRFERMEGKIEGLLAGLEALLDARFGEAGLALMPQLRQIEDPARLAALLQTARKADLDAFRAALAANP